MSEFKLPNLDNEKSVLKTIRIKYNLLNRLEEVSSLSNFSVNRIINECIKFALDNLDFEELKKKNDD